MRLRRSDPHRPGYTRRRRGRGFSYHDRTGAALTDPAELARIRSLAIPPAWREVWISPDPRGHIQAVGTDAAGRRQYRYHDVWRAQRDAAKFDHVLEVGACLPKVREIVAGHLQGRGLTRNRVMATAVRLLDVGCFRIGGEEYASGDEATFGLATLRREHVSVRRDGARFCYPAKGGVQRILDVRDDDVRSVVRTLLRRDSAHPDLLAYRDGAGWCDVRSADINGYLREVSGIDISAKDFRTWNGTVLAAVVLAADELAVAAPLGSPRPSTGSGDRPGPGTGPSDRPGPGAGSAEHTRSAGASARYARATAASVRRTRSAVSRRRAVGRTMREVAEYLGNTPAVAKASYVDPRVVDLFADGITIATLLTDLGWIPGRDTAPGRSGIPDHSGIPDRDAAPGPGGAPDRDSVPGPGRAPDRDSVPGPGGAPDHGAAPSPGAVPDLQDPGVRQAVEAAVLEMLRTGEQPDEAGATPPAHRASLLSDIPVVGLMSDGRPARLPAGQ